VNSFAGHLQKAIIFFFLLSHLYRLSHKKANVLLGFAG
jgi:hypothetical protein